MKPRVFISYSRKDAAFVERLRNDLTAMGVDVWLDSKEIHLGENWANAIDKAIRNATHILLVISSESGKSKWIQREVDFSKSLNKNIVPLITKGGQDELKTLKLEDYVPIDVQHDYEDAIHTLAKSLQRNGNGN